MGEEKSVFDIFKEFSQENDTDLIIYNAPIYENHLHDIILSLQSIKKPKENVSIFLTTYGGSPDDAFRFMRYLQNKYEKVTLYVLGYCKSAGTLIALGADEIVFGDLGELGPLDVQMQKPDHLVKRSSGLDLINSLEVILGQSYSSFIEYMYRIIDSYSYTITTQTAGEFAARLVTGVMKPIAEQIDPIQLGEMYRKIKISSEYGERLVKKDDQKRLDAIEKLTKDYPSHGFVIDYKESKELLGNIVRKINKEEQETCDALFYNMKFYKLKEESYFKFVNPWETVNKKEDSDSGNDPDDSNESHKKGKKSKKVTEKATKSRSKKSGKNGSNGSNIK